MLVLLLLLIDERVIEAEEGEGEKGVDADDEGVLVVVIAEDEDVGRFPLVRLADAGTGPYLEARAVGMRDDNEDDGDDDDEDDNGCCGGDGKDDEEEADDEDGEGAFNRPEDEEDADADADAPALPLRDDALLLLSLGRCGFVCCNSDCDDNNDDPNDDDDDDSDDD